ncbi:MAG: hypothetical protein H3C39_01320 [Flavobacteriia bacterium]|nr:hypothetical protein [Flavobacteriia bacterium]
MNTNTKNMVKKSLIEITKEVFEIIELKDLSQIKEIENSILNDYKKNYVNTENSKRIEFDILESELREISLDSSNINNPLAKLLYALAWKQGDLQKIEHIIHGIEDAHNKENRKKSALVFYNFGKFIAKPEEHPIVDQHVIRAFLVHRAKSENEIIKYRKLKDSSQIKEDEIEDYKNWLRELGKDMDNNSRKEFFYWTDRQLFALGKSIKTK